MARIRIDEQVEPGSPPAGTAYIYVDSVDSHPKVKIDSGTVFDLSNITNITGTPVNDQLAVWTGANGQEGDPNLTWDGSELSVTGDIAVTGTVDGIDVSDLDASVVKLTGAQVIAGIKTFSSFPVTPSSAPTTDYEVANKKYVDDNAGGGGDVVGPGSSTDNNVVFFDGATGKIIKDSGLQLSGSNTGDEVDATTTVKGIVELATDGESAANVVVQGDDSRLSDSRDPNNHASNHTDGTDDIQNATNAQKGLATAAQITTLESAEQTANKDVANGYVGLDGSTQLDPTYIPNDSLTNDQLNDMAANTVKVNNVAGPDNPADLAMPTDTVLIRKSGNIVAEKISTDQVNDDAITNVKAANMSANTVKVRTNASAGDPQDLAMPASTVLARLAAGNIAAATPAEMKALLGYPVIETSEYKVGTTVDPSTTASTPGTAPTLAQMTHTFSGADTTNRIRVWFTGEFSNNNKNGAIACGVFVDGTLEGETERISQEDPNDETEISTMWQGVLPTANSVVDVRYWDPNGSGTVTATGVKRNMIVEEVDI